MVVLFNCFWKRHNVGVCIIPQPSKQDLSRAKSFGRAFLLFLANGGYIHWNHVNGENIWNVFRSLGESLSPSLSLFLCLAGLRLEFSTAPKSPVWTPFAKNLPYLACIWVILPVLRKFSGSPLSSKSFELSGVSKTVSDSSKKTSWEIRYVHCH